MRSGKKSLFEDTHQIYSVDTLSTSNTIGSWVGVGPESDSEKVEFPAIDWVKNSRQSHRRINTPPCKNNTEQRRGDLNFLRV